ncbi:ComF family protein [Campylobacter lanienae]|uniref:ComF family protein n=2 Tax=Campylobacter lanienae TaxID=75658 RepID=UPI000BB3F623|nr:ComF family protein [Campylobacter lanienae]
MKPCVLNGNWKCGWALDLHTISSEHLGGGCFDTKYTEIGGMIYDLKYNDSISSEDKEKLADKLATIAVEFLTTTIMVTPYIFVIVPTPASKDREIQPLYLLADRVAYKLNRMIDFDYIKKIKNTSELKSIEDPTQKAEILKNAFSCDKRYKNKKILLIDDLFCSGSTLNEITKTLYNQGEVNNVYVLCFTKTRSKR